MKEIMAIIRMNKVNATKKSLADMGICSLHAMKVTGRGRLPVEYSIINEHGVREEIGGIIEEGLSGGARLVPKRMFTILVHDEEVKDVIDTVVRINSQGSPGDGKIFVLPVSDAMRIRTGERGEEAV